MVGGIPAGADDFWRVFEKDRCFAFAAMHVIVCRRGEASLAPGGIPVLAGWKDQDAGTAGIDLLGEVVQRVVAAMPADDDELTDALVVYAVISIVIGIGR